MNQFEMVVVIVAIVMFATVLKARYRHRGGEIESRDDGEAIRLREEVKKLQERIHVLERITTDRENSLSREIEELRDN